MSSLITRLALGDLRRDPMLWVGVLLVTIAVAVFIALDLQFLQAVHNAPAPAFEASGGHGTRDDFLTLGTNMLAFSGIPAVVVLAVVLGNVATQTARSHALWRLGGALPGQVVQTIVVQAVAVSLLGAVLGAGAAVLVQERVNTLLVGYGDSDAAGIPTVISPVAVVGTVVVLSLIGVLSALLPAMRAARRSPVGTVQGEAPVAGVGRMLLLGGFVVFGLLPLSASLVAVPTLDDPLLGVVATLPLGQAVVMTTALAGPWLVGSLSSGWTALIGFRRSTSWQVARHLAVARMSTSVAAVTPLMLGLGLFGSLSVIAATAANLPGRDAGLNTFEGMLLLIPVAVIAAVGSLAVILMSGRQRARDIASLRSASATHGDVERVMTFEAIITAVTAGLLAALPVAIQAGLVAFALTSYDVDVSVLRIDLVPAGLLLGLTAGAICLVLLHSGHSAWRRPLMQQLTQE